MRYQAPIHTTKHRVGHCPACRCGLFAEVDIAVELSPPTLGSDGRSVDVHYTTDVFAMRMSHDCDRRTDEEAELLDGTEEDA